VSIVGGYSKQPKKQGVNGHNDKKRESICNLCVVDFGASLWYISNVYENKGE